MNLPPSRPIIFKCFALFLVIFSTGACVDLSPEITLTITPENTSTTAPRTAQLTWTTKNTFGAFTDVHIFTDTGYDLGNVSFNGSQQVIRSKTTTYIMRAATLIPGAQQAEAQTSVTLDVDEPQLSITDYFTSLMSDNPIPGLAAILMVDGNTVWSGAFGNSRLQSPGHNAIPVTLDTPFMLASISKTLMGTAYLHAWENALGTPNEFSLDTNINDMGLPFTVDNPKVENENITLRHLASHTSGLVDNSDFYWCAFLVNGEFPTVTLQGQQFPLCNRTTPKEFEPLMEAFYVEYPTPGQKSLLYSATKNFAATNPGEVSSYSNTAAALAGLAFQYKVGTSIDDYILQNIAGPLNLSSMKWHPSDYPPDTLAIPYTYNAEDGSCVPFNVEIPCVQNYYEYQDYFEIIPYPAGGLKASVNDVAKYLRMIVNNGELDGTQILQPSTLAEFNFNEPNTTNMFWRSWTASDGTNPVMLKGHQGATVGVSTGMFFDPNTKIAMVFLMNTDIATWKGRVYSDIVNRLYTEGQTYITP